MNIPSESWLKRILPAGVVLMLLTISACGGGGSTDGRLNLGIADAPVSDLTAVQIEFNKVQVQSKEGTTYEFDLNPSKQLDLLQLTGGKAANLIDKTLPAGEYVWIRLFVDETFDNSYVEEIGGAKVALTIPSDAQSGLKINSGFKITVDDHVNFVIDFDLRKSLHQPGTVGDPYILRPTLRLVDATITGSITGTVNATLLAANNCTGGDAVYVYSGSSITPDDIGSRGAKPVTTASVELVDGEYTYTAAFLNPGYYTVAFTCQADSDVPDANDPIVFVKAANVSLDYSQAKTYDFVP